MLSLHLHCLLNEYDCYSSYDCMAGMIAYKVSKGVLMQWKFALDLIVS